MNLNELAKEKGIKITTQREIIYNILVNNMHNHLTAKDIEKIVERKDMHIGISTIYRTLELFERLGVVIRHNFNSDTVSYEFAFNNSKDHHHLICKECGKVLEVTGLMPKNLNEILMEMEFEYQSYNLKIYGLCKDCMDKNRLGLASAM